MNTIRPAAAAAAVVCACLTPPASAAPSEPAAGGPQFGWSPAHRMCPQWFTQQGDESDWEPVLDRAVSPLSIPRHELSEVRWLPLPDMTNSTSGLVQCHYTTPGATHGDALVLQSRFLALQPTLEQVWTNLEQPAGALACDPRLPKIGVLPRCSVVAASTPDARPGTRALPF